MPLKAAAGAEERHTMKKNTHIFARDYYVYINISYNIATPFISAVKIPPSAIDFPRAIYQLDDADITAIEQRASRATGIGRRRARERRKAILHAHEAAFAPTAPMRCPARQALPLAPASQRAVATQHAHADDRFSA